MLTTRFSLRPNRSEMPAHGTRGVPTLGCLYLLVLVALLAMLPVGEAMAAIAVRSAAQASVQGVSNIAFVKARSARGDSKTRTVKRPGSVKVGRLMIAQVVVKGQNVPIVAPFGWTLIHRRWTSGSDGSDAVTQAIYWKRMTSGEPKKYKWSWDGVTRRNAVGIVSYDNVDTVDSPIDAYGAQAAENSSTITIPGVMTLVPKSWIVALAGSSRSGSHPRPAGMTERYDRNSGGGVNGVTASQSTQPRPTPGYNGPRFLSIAPDSADNIGHMLALRPLGSTLTIDKPAGTQPGDVMIASIAFRPCSATNGGLCTTTITPPAGWTQVNTVTDQTTGGGTGGFGNRLFVYRRVATGAEPARYTWRFGNTPVHTGATGGIVSFSGVDTANPIDVQAGQTTPSSTSHTAPSLTTTVAGTMLLSTHSENSSVAWTPPAGMTERVDIASHNVGNSVGIALEMNTQPFAGPGATGTRTGIIFPSYRADTGITHMLALRPAVSLHHYAIAFPGGATGVTCDPHAVTITAHDAAHNPVAPPAGTVVNLSTSTGTGVWTTLQSGSGTWNPSGLNNGLAGYTWPGGETSFTVKLRHNTPVTLNIHVSDGARSEHATEDPNLSFADAAFRLTDATGSAVLIGTHIAGKPSNTGFGAQALFLQAIRTDTNTGSCTTLFQNQTVTVGLAGARIDPTGGASQVAIQNSAGSFVNVATSAGAPPGAYTGVSLAFDAQSKAPLVFSYPDAGRIAIYARYQLPSPPPNTYVAGSSNDFVVRPFGLRISNVPTVSSPSPSSPVFWKAGQNFDVNLTAVAWKTGDDTNADGVPDSDAQIAGNPATPNFGHESSPATATLTHSLNAPSGGEPGLLGGATLFSGFSGGAKTQAVNWSEVGFIDLHATTQNYLGLGQNVTNSAAGLTGVGRFYPHHFDTVTQNACTAGSTPFTYSGQPFPLVVYAKNAAGGTTQNYAGSFAKDVSFSDVNGALGSFDTLPAGRFTLGVADTSSSPEIAFTFTDKRTPPATVRVRANDADTANAAGSQEGVVDVRSGRLRLANAHGSERLPLKIPLAAEYFDGAVFRTNSADNCTGFTASQLTLSNWQRNLNPGETAPVAGTFPLTLASGLASITLSAPGVGNSGSVDLTLDVPAWLEFDWAGTVGDPKARATFGIFRAPGPLIYRRERY